MFHYNISLHLEIELLSQLSNFSRLTVIRMQWSFLVVQTAQVFFKTTLTVPQSCQTTLLSSRAQEDYQQGQLQRNRFIIIRTSSVSNNTEISRASFLKTTMRTILLTMSRKVNGKRQLGSFGERQISTFTSASCEKSKPLKSSRSSTIESKIRCSRRVRRKATTPVAIIYRAQRTQLSQQSQMVDRLATRTTTGCHSLAITIIHMKTVICCMKTPIFP